jgi:hypothetical protein
MGMFRPRPLRPVHCALIYSISRNISINSPIVKSQILDLKRNGWPGIILRSSYFTHSSAAGLGKYKNGNFQEIIILELPNDIHYLLTHTDI